MGRVRNAGIFRVAFKLNSPFTYFLSIGFGYSSFL